MKKRPRPTHAKHSPRCFEQLESRLAMTAISGDMGSSDSTSPAADHSHSAVVSDGCFDCTPHTPEFFPWTNSSSPYDVDGDGEVAPGDALAIINYLNTVGPGPVPGPIPVTSPKVAPYLDTTADNQVAPDDVLAVLDKLHYLNLVDQINRFQNAVVNELVTPLHVEGVLPIPVENGSQPPGNFDNIPYPEFISLVQSVRKKVEDSQSGSVSRDDAERAVDELMSSIVVHRERIFVRR